MAVYIKKIKQKTKSVKNRWKEIYMRHRYVSGITVIELVLILVKNLALYIACLEGEKSLKNKLYVRHTQ